MRNNIILVMVLSCLISVLVTDDAHSQDWANLARFSDDNDLLKTPVNGEKRVVFMGDSITEGWSELAPDFFAGKAYINRGISGQTTPQMLVRFREDVIRLAPAVVVILAGTNDIAENTGPTTLDVIAGNIASMAELARASGIRVVICSVLPAFDYPWRPGLHPDKKIPALNAMLKEYAAREGFVYLDYFSAMTDGKNGLQQRLTSDGVHPTAAGFNVMGPMAESAIETALNQ
jgi:lysophospholipase L1-like esterase